VILEEPPTEANPNEPRSLGPAYRCRECSGVIPGGELMYFADDDKVSPSHTSTIVIIIVIIILIFNTNRTSRALWTPKPQYQAPSPKALLAPQERSHPICRTHFVSSYARKCAYCQQKITQGMYCSGFGRHYHEAHMRYRPSPLLMHRFCTQQRVTWCMYSAANGNSLFL
jgi:hypothetical protein